MSDLILFWHRRDLRISDNTGIAAALQKTRKVVGVFCLDPNILKGDDVAAVRVSYMIGCLQKLQEKYAQAGSQLLILWDNPVKAIPKLAKALNVKAVFWNWDVEPYSQQRDADDDIDECRHHGIPEHVVVPQFGVVRETDELPADEGPGVREGQDDRVDEGVEGEHDGPHDCRGHQQPRCVPAVGVHGAQSLGEVGERTTILLVPQQGGASRKITW